MATSRLKSAQGVKIPVSKLSASLAVTMKNLKFSYLLLLATFPNSAFASNGKGQFGLIIISIIVLWIIFYGSAYSKVYLFKLISVIALIVGYAFFLMKIGQHLQLKFTPEKDIGLVSILIFLVGWFGPLVWYAKNSEKS